MQIQDICHLHQIRQESNEAFRLRLLFQYRRVRPPGDIQKVPLEEHQEVLNRTQLYEDRQGAEVRLQQQYAYGVQRHQALLEQHRCRVQEQDSQGGVEGVLEEDQSSFGHDGRRSSR